MKLPSNYFRFSASTTLRLSTVAIVGLWLWFVGKFFLQADRPGLLVALSLCLLGGTILSILVFVSTYSFVANAPEGQIDERELALRNRAYFKTVQYVFVWLLIGLVGSEIAQRRGISMGAAVFQNFLTCLMITTLIVPSWLLARWDADASPE
ncbi:MAG: hypothetical protein ACKOKG_03240 [Verrucomicrobiota bacterium]